MAVAISETRQLERHRERKLRGLAEPVLRARPFFVRLCEAFVENLAQVLRTALVLGGLVLVQELQVLHGLLVPSEEGTALTQSVSEEPPSATDVSALDGPWLTEGVQQALNCTRADYRNEHYDECVTEPSEVYRRPEAESDNTGFIAYDELVLYASLNGAVTRNPANTR